MKLPVFQFLCIKLEKTGGLTPSKFITVEEQVAMFLFTVSRAASNRDVQQRFQHSGETVSRYFHAVLNAINRLVPQCLNLSSANNDLRIKHRLEGYPFFDNCIGAFDSTQINIKLPQSQNSTPNQADSPSRQVLSCCRLDKLLFTYILAGWNESAHDGDILEAAINEGFEIPAGKFYLGDEGFALTPWCMTPYTGVTNDHRNQSNIPYVLALYQKSCLIAVAPRIRRSCIIYDTHLYGSLSTKYSA